MLRPVVQRYIDNCLQKKISRSKIKTGLEKDIYAFEIDKKHYEACIDNLNSLASEYNIYDVNWKIFNIDSLKYHFEIKFDYIIGNPPYVTYQELHKEQRQYIKDKFDTCKKGKFDYCYAFIENDLKLLAPYGRMTYLIPSSIFKNVYAQELREFIKPYITAIYDFTVIKVFPDALTSSAVMICENKPQKESEHVNYYDVAHNKVNIISRNVLENKWKFHEQQTGKVKFSSYFKASIVIATLLNKAFVLDDFTREEEFFTNGTDIIEADIVRATTSPRLLNYNKKANIIFPYYYENGILKRYSEEQFLQLFPNATRYLNKFMDKLLERDCDKSATWFEYGRSQALEHINQPKLLLSTVVTNAVKVYELSKDIIPFSGIYITPTGKYSLQMAKQILESNEFYEYVRNIGIYASGNSIRITAKDINNFDFNTQNI
ncbi:Eco57I restriction-modification methylase domain-containing protein [Geovibrio sp. ADMFC3]